MKKIFLVLSCLIFLSGCGTENSDESSANFSDDSQELPIELSLGERKWQMSLPKNWETVPAKPQKGIIFLARFGSQNLVISNEVGNDSDLIKTLLETTKKSLDMIEPISQTEDTLIFRGKLSATTPQREFYQKVLLGPENRYLLVSCSQEVVNLEKLDCPEILNSIYLKEGETE